MSKRFFILTSVLFLLTLSLGWTYLVIPQNFLSLDNRLRDFLFILRGPIPTTENVVIVDIDERSLKKYGQWPWSRHIIASLLAQLRDDGAGIIGLDIVFAEADNSMSSITVEDFGECANSHDASLAAAIRETPVIGGYFFSFDFNTTQAPSIPAIFIEKGLTSTHYIPEPNGARLNIDCLQNAFYSSGFFNTTPDLGGMIRHVPLVMRYHDILYPSLALEMIRIYTDSRKVTVLNSQIGTEAIELNHLRIPTDRYARIGVNFRGPGHHFHYISALDIIEKRAKQKEIEGKFVLIGTSALGLSDLKATSFDNVMPGVEIHANMIDMILSDDFITIPYHAELINLSLIAMTVFTAVFGFYLLNSWLILPMLLLYLYSMYRFYNYMLFDQGYILNILFPMIALLSTMIITLLLRFVFTSQDKRHIQQAFSKKVSPAVMHDIMTNETQKLLKPREKNVTVFFSDIRSFTTISETIANPTRLIRFLNEYMTPMVEIIIQHKGTIDKFIGDAIMAYWNAPTNVENHADHAVQSALEQLEKLKKLNKDIKQQYDTIINIGIGIHTGIVTIGEMGSFGRSDYTIIGDNVNLASRLESLCKVYGVSLIISEQTKNALYESYLIRELDWVKVKGKTESVVIFEVLAVDTMTSAQEKEFKNYYEALSLYRDGKFDEAEVIFSTLAHVHLLYRMYQERCIYLMKENISDFDGIFTFNTK